jgi:DNA-binding LacI/PurR family transcriptional regulator
MATMNDVAKLANVSLSTVSYALNGKRPISEATRARILLAMAELDFQPNAMARALASKRSGILALLFPISERGLGITELEFIISATDTAREFGYHLVLWTMPIQSPEQLHQLVQQGLVDGVIVMEVRLNDERITYLQDAGIPFSVIGRMQAMSAVAYVDTDFDVTAQASLDYLTALGHRHIAFVNQAQEEADTGYGPVVRAREAFLHSIAGTGISGTVHHCHATPQAGYELFPQLLAADPALTAVIVMNERIFPGLLQAIADEGKRVPEDLSLVAIQASGRVAEFSVPPLTVFALQSVELGRLGVTFLVRQLAGDTQLPAPVLLPCKLIEGGSTAVAAPQVQVA